MTGELKIVESIVDSSGERGLLKFDDGTKAYWEVDGPYYIRHTSGEFTKEWTGERARWNEEGLTIHAQWLEDNLPQGNEPEMRAATEEEVIEINETIDECRWPGDNHQVRRISTMWETIKLTTSNHADKQHVDWSEGLDQIESHMKYMMEIRR